MGDPVTLAVIGGSVGAMMNRRDPLKGALMGAAAGYGGGALMGAGGAGAAAAGTAAGTGAAAGTAAGTTAAGAGTVGATGGGFAAGGYGSVGIGGQTALAGGAAAPSGFMANTMAGIGADLSAVQGWANKNPLVAGMALNTANQMMEPHQMQMPGASPLMHGQVAQGDTSLLSLLPQQQRQPISLI